MGDSFYWHERAGVVDRNGRQIMQLIGGTKRERRFMGHILIDALNARAARDAEDISDAAPGLPNMSINGVRR